VSELCFLCGQPGADTSDHVVSKTFYVPPLPDDMITLPAHKACNRSTSKDEEWVSIGWASCRLTWDPNDARYVKAKRSLLRDEAPGLRHAFLSSLLEVPSAGGFLDLGETRVQYVVAKMVKGFVYRADRLLLSDYLWWMRSVDLELMVSLPLPRYEEAHDIAVIKWSVIEGIAGSRRPTIFWALGTYNVHLFAGLAIPPEDAHAVPVARSALALPWPKPV
jgi:hypothetical protein